MYFAEVKHGYFEHGKAFEAKKESLLLRRLFIVIMDAIFL